jgi:hypothetical protein
VSRWSGGGVGEIRREGRGSYFISTYLGSTVDGDEGFDEGEDYDDKDDSDTTKVVQTTRG